jgi:hypothetical protein
LEFDTETKQYYRYSANIISLENVAKYLASTNEIDCTYRTDVKEQNEQHIRHIFRISKKIE